MAGWINSTSGASGGGRGFPNRRYTNSNTDIAHGGRWRGDRPRGRPPPQPQYRYRPVDASQRHSPPSSTSQQQAAPSTSSLHALAATDKSSASATTTPPSTREPDDKDKAARNAANFECNVCFDMAAEPVVTKCGHLFCWECLYQWLHVHSHHRECPVCKGQVADDAIIPIYGRGGSAASVENAPPRPTGVRVESSRQQQHSAFTHPTGYMDEEEDPFDFPGMMNFGFGGTLLRDAVMRFMPPSFEDMDLDNQYEEYDTDDFDEVYDYDLLGFPVFASAGAEPGNPGSSRAHAHVISNRDNIAVAATTVYHHQEFGYTGANSRSRGRHGRRYRTRASADHSSTDGMVMGGAFYRDNSASSNVNAGASFRPSGGWAERRGRSGRNPNSGGGRGMQDSRRQRTAYN